MSGQVRRLQFPADGLPRSSNSIVNDWLRWHCCIDQAGQRLAQDQEPCCASGEALRHNALTAECASLLEDDGAVAIIVAVEGDAVALSE